MAHGCIVNNTTNHSDDLLSVYVGRREPVAVCGYHYFANTVEYERLMRVSGVVAPR